VTKGDACTIRNVRFAYRVGERWVATQIPACAELELEINGIRALHLTPVDMPLDTRARDDEAIAALGRLPGDGEDVQR